MLFTDHVTAALLAPLTVAVNCAVRPACTVAEVGVTETATEDPAGVTVTTALADFVGSALLTAVMVSEGLAGGVAGAMNRPVEEIVPTLASPPWTLLTDQVTELSVVPFVVTVY